MMSSYMPIYSQPPLTPAEQLLSLWQQRYRVDLSVIPGSKNPELLSQVIEFARPESKALTAKRCLQKLDTQCDLAGITTNQLLNYLDNVVDFSEARELASALKQVYAVLLDLYQETTLPENFSPPLSYPPSSIYAAITAELDIPSLQHLEHALEPHLRMFRDVHQRAADPRMIGFLTTLFHFANYNLLGSLPAAERILLAPYCRFVEEQVCIPWSRIYQAAIHHRANSPVLHLVEKMVPLGSDISQEVLKRLQSTYRTHSSRRGKLFNPEIQASTRRDLEMLQAYLHLCLLENSVAAVANLFLPLCLMVFPSIGVDWKMVEGTFPILLDAFQQRLTPAEMETLAPTFAAMQSLFSQDNPTVKVALTR